mgnify:CR=1 FL=1
MVWWIGSFGESDIVLGGRECSDCDTCGRVICSEDLLWRGVKAKSSVEDSSNEIKRVFLDNRWDNL